MRTALAFLVALTVGLVVGVGCDQPSGTDAEPNARPEASARPDEAGSRTDIAGAERAEAGEQQAEADAPDASLADDQAELLDVAFRSATKMPIHPHIKTRSRLQEDVVEACLKLDQPERALEYLKKIDNWRRGAAYADLAFYHARRGGGADVERYLELAERVSANTEEWRKDRIRVKIAAVYHQLGKAAEAERFEAGVEDSEEGKASVAEAMNVDEANFAAMVESLDAAVAAGNYDITKNMLGGYGELYRRFYEDSQKRSLLEAKILAAFDGTPYFLRIERLLAMADVALDHDDPSSALKFVGEAQVFVEQPQWRPEDRVRLTANIAAVRFRAGEEAEARAALAEALTFFEAEVEKIVDIYQARPLRAVAEAYHAMGETSKALDVYALAIEAGVKNSNSRPRAEDLCATCLSMALHRVKPGDTLSARIQQISDELGKPW